MTFVPSPRGRLVRASPERTREVLSSRGIAESEHELWVVYLDERGVLYASAIGPRPGMVLFRDLAELKEKGEIYIP